MLRLLERNIASIERRLMLLAPAHASVGDFRNLTVDATRHDALVREVQRLRGSIYLDDGAVQREQLSSEGLHRTPEDARSWHLLMLNKAGRVSSCAWYMEHDGHSSIDGLRVRNCPLSGTGAWGDKLREAVESELERARRDRLRYAEVGGWAVAPGSRCTSEGLLLALAAYSLGRKLGGALGITTATVRHASSTILKRLGGSHLEVQGDTVPPYFDPAYGCVMELLRFDSRRPNEKYSTLIDVLKEKLSNVPVVCSASSGLTAASMMVPQPRYAA